MFAAKCKVAIFLLISLQLVGLALSGGANKARKRWAIRHRLLYLGAMQDDCLKDGSECPDGFGMDIWIKSGSQTGYLVSNGGQSSKANGFYARKPVPGEYEVGVALQTELWRLFVYLEEDKEIHLGFTFDRNDGLKLYVDGLLAGQRRTSEIREFASENVDMMDSVNSLIANGNSERFGELFDSRYRAIPGYEPGEVLNMTYYYSNDDNVVRKVTKDIDSRLTAGCYSSVPSSFVRSSIAMPPAGTNESYSYFVCRNSCVGSTATWIPKAAVVDPATGGCFCASDAPSNTADCGDSSAITARYTSVSLSDPTWIPNFSVAIMNPQPEYFVGDAITFEVTGIYDDVTFQYDFGDDSIPMPTKSTVTTHTYKAVGKYIVKLNMEYGARIFSNESLFTFNIKPVHVPKPPNDFEIVSTSVQPSGSAFVKIAVFGEDSFKCQWKVSPAGSNALVQDDRGRDPSDFLYEANQKPTRIEKELSISGLKPGVYSLVATCSNDYGTMSKERQFVLPYHEPVKSKLAKNTATLDIAALNFDSLASPAVAVSGGQSVGLSVVDSTKIQLRQLDSVLQLGSNVFEVKIGGEVFCTVEITVFQPVSGGTITVTAPFTPYPTGYALSYAVYVEAGEQVSGTIDFGDGQDTVEIPAFDYVCPCNYSGTHVYSNAGDFAISTVVQSGAGGEAVTIKSDTFTVAVPAIGETSIKITPNTGKVFANETVTFELTVSSGFSLYGTIDFSGRVEEFRFDNLICPCSKTFTHMYRVVNTNNSVRATIMGDYSSDVQKTAATSVLVVTLPVGESRLDVLEAEERYLPGDVVTFKLTVESGEAVEGTMDFGDGSPVHSVSFHNDVCPCTYTIQHEYTAIGTFSASASVYNLANRVNIKPVEIAVEQEGVAKVRVRPTDDSSNHMALGDAFQIDYLVSEGEQVSVDFDFGDGTAVESKELFTDDNQACPCSGKSEQHFYQNPGMYVVKATFSNSVGKKTVQIVVTVNYRLMSMNLEASTDAVADINSSPVMFTVTIQAGNGSNMPGPVWVECTMENQTETRFLDNFTPASESVNFSHVFTKFTAFSTTCKARNNITSVVSGESIVRIGTPMSSIATYPLRTVVAINESAPVAILLPEGVGSVFTITLTPEEGAVPAYEFLAEQDVVASPRVTTVRDIKVPSPGRYTFVVSARNAFGNLSAQSCQMITVVTAEDGETACTTLTASIHGEAPEIFQSYPKNITVTVNTDCDRTIHTEAQLFQEDPSSGLLWPVAELCSISSDVPVAENSSMGPHLPFPGGILLTGTYIAKVEVTVDGYKRGVVALFDTPFDIVASPLSAGFVRIPESLMEGEPLILDFAPSGDPDVGLDTSDGIRFDVFCSRFSEPENMTFNELTATSLIVKENANYQTWLRDFNGTCFNNETVDVTLTSRKMVFEDAFKTDISYYMFLFVHKKGRAAPGRAVATIHIGVGNQTTDQILDRIEDLLNSGDKSAALNAINAVSQVLNKQANSTSGSGDAEGRKKARGRILGLLDNVSSKLDDFGQLSSTGSALSSVTVSRGEVTDDAKQRAGNALANVGNATRRFNDKPLFELTDVASTIVGAVGNILPTPEEQATKSSLFEGKTPSNESLVNSSMSTTMYPSTSAEMISTTAATLSTVRLYTSTVAPSFNSSDSEDIEELTDALAALGESSLPGRRTNERCEGATLPSDFNVKQEIEILSAENSFFNKREIRLIEACAIYRGISLPCLFYFEDPSQLRKLYRSCIDEEEKILAEKRRRDKELTRNSVGSLNAVSGTLMSRQESGSDAIDLATPQLSLKLMKVNGSNGTGGAMGSSTGGFKIPASTMGNSSGNGSLGMQFLSTASNPFSYVDSAANIKSGVVTLAFLNDDGSAKDVSNTSEPFDIRTKGKPETAPPASNYTVFAPEVDVELLPMNYHRISINKNGSSLHIVLRPTGEVRSFEVFIGKGFFPNETFYNFTQAVPLDDSHEILQSANDDESKEELRYTVFPPPSMTKLNGTYYIGIKIVGARIELPYVAQNYTYNLRMFTSGCMFWNEETETWAGDGCEVGPQTTIYETQCLCTHLTSFGTDFMTPPNAIDFNTVWSKFDAKNATVYSVMIALIVLYLILAVWARSADKNDLSRWQPRPLTDNLPTDRYYYQISIFTGFRSQSETQSRVRMIVVGAKGDTGVRCIQPARQSKPFIFKNGSINHFILSTEQPLGQLSYLRIWHDNSGKGHYRSWYLQQIQISDLQSEKRYYFLNDRWLGVDHDDGSVERVVPVANLNDLISFRYLFSSDLRRRFGNDHIWLSVVNRPTRSIFTRVQRLTVCLSMLFTTMLCNAMFFENEPPEPQEYDEYGAHKTNARNTIQLGPIRLSLQEVWVAVVSSLIVVPIHSLCIYIFTSRRRPKTTARVGQEGISTVTKATPRWKPVDDKTLAEFDDGDALTSRRQGVRGFFNRAGKKLFKNNSENYETDESKERRIFKKKSKKRGPMLPAWSSYVAYSLLAIAMIISVFFLLLYSMSWGIEKSNRWMAAFVLSFLNESFVIESVKIIAVVSLLSCIFKKPQQDEEEHHQIDATKEEVERWVVENRGRMTRDEFDDISKRRHSKPAELMPPDRETLADSRQRRLHELQMETIVRDVIVYFVFVIIAFFLGFSMRGHASYTMYTEMHNLMQPGFANVKTPDDYWRWLNNVAIPALYPDTNWKDDPLGWREAQQISDFANLRIGAPRLRQFRVRDDSCKVNGKISQATHGERCIEEYDWYVDDTKPYLPKWVPITEDEANKLGGSLDNLTDLTNTPLLRNSPWRYQGTLELNGVSYSANEYTYKGGGYVAEFKRTKRETLRVINHLMKFNWIDENTRAVFLEFSTYNPNANLFTAPIVAMEFMATGNTSPRLDIKVFTLYEVVGTFQLLIYAFGIVFLLYTIVYARVEYKRMKAVGWREYFQEYFNVITLAMIVFCFISVILYFVRMLMARLAANSLAGAGKESYVNYGALAVNGEIFIVFVGCSCFFATLNFLKILNFNRRLAMLGMVLAVAMKDIKPFAIVFLGVFFAFAQLYFFAMGSYLKEYSSLIQSLETLMAASLGNFNFVSVRNVSPLVGPFAFVLFLIIVMITLMGMFAVIMETAARIRKQLRDEHNPSSDYETVVYLWRKFKGLFGFYDD